VATDGTAYQLLGRTETLPFNLVVLLVFAVPALTALAVPIAAAVRRLRRRPAQTSTRWRLARGLTAGAALLGIVFLFGLTVIVIGGSGEFIFGVPVSFGLLLAIPIIVLAAAAAALACTITGWRGSGAGIVAGVHQVVLLLGITAFAWFVWQWNLLGWQYA
jgi:hypothetical protein